MDSSSCMQHPTSSFSSAKRKRISKRMEVAVSAARWVVGKALGPVTDGLLEAWAASAGLGPNIDVLKMELLYAQGMLDNAQGRNVRSPALEELLYRLRRLAYDADDVLDELDYFRIQDALDYFRIQESSNMPVSGRQRDRAMQTPKLKFDREEMSRKMKDIVEQLKPLCDKVSTILNLELLGSTIHNLELLGSNRTTRSTILDSNRTTMNRSKTTPAIIEPKLYGRESQKKSIACSITHGKYSANELTVLPIVGPGGIGKTTFTQHLYDEVKSHFQVPVWICVSHDFNVNRLLQEIEKKIPKFDGEKERLQSKRFLLVLDDMWTYQEDEWKKLLAPFKKGGIEGNMVIVTTRSPEVANMVRTTDCSIDLKRLSDEDTMCLFEACVFGDQQPWEDHDHVLHQVGRDIVAKLKGFPLAAKTVGRLLRNQLALDHWTRVLDSKEWELQTNDDDIMPALKLSYDYLPFHLQQCFSYCALFPEDHEFKIEELIHLWLGLGLLDASGQNKRIEDIGLSYLNDLGNHGFFKKEEKADGSHYYVIHDLFHELATKVSSYECLSIRSSNVKSMQIPPSIRHVSIIIDERDVSDIMTFEDCKRDLSTLDKRLKVENLRTLMLFGEYHRSFAKTFGDLFREAKALRVILLSDAYYTVEDVLHNLSEFLHLRYLRITTGYYYGEVSLDSTITRFYHLRVLDLKQCKGHFEFPRDMSNLVKLRHFLVRDNEVHSSIFEVGKLIFLQELRSFMVMKENKGFELRQIGQLVEVGGSLGIYNLEKVKGKEEAHEAKLIHKNHLHELILCWDSNRSSKDPIREEHVLESLKPHSNLRKLCIRGHGGTNCPTWLDVNFSTKRLESLCLEDVAWNKLPPLGWVVDESGDECPRCITGQRFDNLKKLELVKIPRLKKWVGNVTCLFSHLEVLIIKDCSELMELPFSRSTCCQPQQEANMTWFRRLLKLEIVDCPKLLSLPPIPWTSTPCSAKIARAGSGFERLDYSQEYTSELGLRISGKLLFSHFPKLTKLSASDCEKITVLGVVEQQTSTPAEIGGEEIAATGLLLLPPQLQELDINGCPELSLRTNSLDDATAGGGLQSLHSLRWLNIRSCPKFLSSYSLSSSGFPFPTSLQHLALGGVEGMGTLAPLSNLTSLTFLAIDNCRDLRGEGLWPLLALKLVVSRTPNFFVGSEPSRPHEQELLRPSSKLRELRTDDVAGLLVAPIFTLLSSSSLTYLHFTSNEEVEAFTKEQDESLQRLTSLQELEFSSCRKLQSLPAGVHGLDNLRRLQIDNCSAIRSLPKDGLPSSLQELKISSCPAIRSLPKDGLPSSLQELKISSCPAICSLPKDGLPSSLRVLEISSCPNIRSLPKDGLPSSLQVLEISSCPNIRSLPKDGLPSSLRILDVDSGNSEELRRQCRKLSGTIPIIKA